MRGRVDACKQVAQCFDSFVWLRGHDHVGMRAQARVEKCCSEFACRFLSSRVLRARASALARRARRALGDHAGQQRALCMGEMRTQTGHAGRAAEPRPPWPHFAACQLASKLANQTARGLRRPGRAMP